MFEFLNKKDKKKRSKANIEAGSNNVVSLGQKETREHHIFLDAQTILNRPNCRKSIFQLKEAIGVNEEYFDKYYMPVIESIAIRAQAASASEYNHHAYEFGLIEHTLETAVFAVRSSYQFNYFPDGDEEKIQVLTPIYTYTTFIAAMLHDAGKAISDVQFKRKIKGEWQIWSPIYATIPTEKEEAEYKIERKKDSNGNAYFKNTHEIVGAVLLTEVVPAIGLKWISDYAYKYSPFVFTHLIHAVGGDLDNAGAIGQNVAAGDKTSTEDYMSKNVSTINSNQSFGELKNIPIHEAFVKTVRTLLHDHEAYKITVNKRHCAKISHVERYGDMVFMASKFITELASKEMTAQGVNVPSERKMYQILSDNNISYKTPSDDSLWWCDFYTNEEANPRDLTYIAIDMEALANPPLPDLAEEGVKIRFAPKTTNNMDHGPMPINNENDQNAHDQIFASKPQTEEVAEEHKIVEDKAKQIAIETKENPTLDDILPEPPKVVQNQNLEQSLGGLASLAPKNPTEKKPNNKKPNEKKSNTKKDTKKQENNTPKKDTNKQKNNDNPTNTESPLDDLFGAPSTAPSTSSTPSDSPADAMMDNQVGQNDLPPNDHEEYEIQNGPSHEIQTSSPVAEEKLTDTQINNDEQDIPAPVSFFRAPGIPASITTGKGRPGQRTRADKECNESLFPYIQQQIDSGALSFNKKDSTIHNTEHGLLIISPKFFEHFDKTLSKKHRTTIKRSSYCYHFNDTSILTFEANTDDEAKIASGRNKVNGFLLAYNGLCYNDKPLPVNNMLKLISGS